MGRSNGGSVAKKFKKILPAEPRRGPEAGVIRIQYDFHNSDVKRIRFMFVSQEHGFTIFSFSHLSYYNKN